VLGALGRKPALAEVERIDAQGRGPKSAMLPQPGRNNPCGTRGAAGEGEVRLEVADIEIGSCREERVVQALAKLEEVGVPRAYAHPDDLGGPFRGNPPTPSIGRMKDSTWIEARLSIIRSILSAGVSPRNRSVR